MRLSLIIPAYNEEKRIGATLRVVSEYLAKQEYTSEIIVVDDGSRDNTLQVVRNSFSGVGAVGMQTGRLQHEVDSFPGVRALTYHPNRGKGHAVRTGMLAAAGEFRVFYDADASTPIEELEKLWPKFAEGAALVIGSRSLPESRVQVRQPWYRENMGRLFNLLLRLFRLTRFPDTQCGFKGFTAAACETVFPRQTIERYSFDAELLFIAAKHGLRVEQVPVRWINCPQTHLNALFDSTRMLFDLLTIRIKDAARRYS